MSRKALNAKNLMALGPERMAELLVEVTKGSAALQRRLRLELSAHMGPEEAVRDVRKRFATIRQAKGFIARKYRRNFTKELASLVTLIENPIASQAPDDAFDLLWSFLHLTTGILDRMDDTDGSVAELVTRVHGMIALLAPRLGLSPDTLADTVFEALQDNAHGQFDGVIAALAPALGTMGMDRLTALATKAAAGAQGVKARMANRVLLDMADLRGDVDAYIARHPAAQLTAPAIAADIALRLLRADRATEALRIIDHARADTPELFDLRIACLTTLGETDQVKGLLWQDFERTLAVESLRRHLRLLPDFDDIEAEDRARELALDHEDAELALVFFLDWPDFASAAALIERRAEALDGASHHILAPASEALDAAYPLASVLARRLMILDTLGRNRTPRFADAARHLQDCAMTNARIADYGNHADHYDFVRALRISHARKPAFWKMVDRP